MTDKLDQILSKIVSLEEGTRIVNKYKTTDQKVVFTNGCFDILHKGHYTLIHKAASLGNRLVIGLNGDSSVKRLKGASRPIHQEDNRALALASMAFVDLVILFEEDTPLQLIQTLNPDVLVKGGDYSLTTIVGADTVIHNGGEVIIIPLEEGYATTKIIETLSQQQQ